MPSSTVWITGIRLPAKVSTDATRSLMDSDIFVASPVPKEVITFCQDACIMLSDPDIVLAASLAVVPAIPMLSCITWIALTTSA